MITEEDIDILKKRGWKAECESPFEIRHEDESFGSVLIWKFHDRTSIINVIQLTTEGEI